MSVHGQCINSSECEFFQATDLITSELDSQFDQSRMKTFVQREKTVLYAVNDPYSDLHDIAVDLLCQAEESQLLKQCTPLDDLSKQKGLRTATYTGDY